MTDKRFRTLVALLVAAVAAAAAGCASTPAQAPAPPPEPVVAAEAEAIAFPDEEDAPFLPPPVFEMPAEREPLAPAVVYGDVLVRIREHLSLPQVEHARVDREIEWLQRNPDYLARVFGRAQRYLHHIVNEVEARGLPGDLALLPIVESAFNPFAYSRSHASGLWQFIAPTGERYGLSRNYWQDQRRDVIESTDAALDYLAHLRDRFDGNWFLAIAAYNYGSGNIRRAINRNLALRRKTDYFSLSLPAETRAYVPKLVALAKMIREPEAYGFYLPPIPDTAYFRVVETGGPVDLRLMAELAGVDTEELHALNPSWNRWLTDPDGPHRVLVPEVVADGFAAKFAALGPHSRAGRVARLDRGPLQGAGELRRARQRRPPRRAEAGRPALGALGRRLAAARGTRLRPRETRAPRQERRVALEHLAPLRNDRAAARAHEPHLRKGHDPARSAAPGRRIGRQRRGSGDAHGGRERQGELQGPARRHALRDRAPVRGDRPRAPVLE
jgi:soluble lytic murein transglycosylase-like protein